MSNLKEEQEFLMKKQSSLFREIDDREQSISNLYSNIRELQEEINVLEDSLHDVESKIT